MKYAIDKDENIIHCYKQNLNKSNDLNSIYLIFSIKVKIKSRDPFWNDFAVLSVLNTSKILDFTTLVNFSWVYRPLWRFQFDITRYKKKYATSSISLWGPPTLAHQNRPFLTWLFKLYSVFLIWLQSWPEGSLNVIFSRINHHSEWLIWL